MKLYKLKELNCQSCEHFYQFKNPSLFPTVRGFCRKHKESEVKYLKAKNENDHSDCEFFSSNPPPNKPPLTETKIHFQKGSFKEKIELLQLFDDKRKKKGYPTSDDYNKAFEETCQNCANVYICADACTYFQKKNNLPRPFSRLPTRN